MELQPPHTHTLLTIISGHKGSVVEVVSDVWGFAVKQGDGGDPSVIWVDF